MARRSDEEEEGRRDFHGRSLLINVLRAAHVAGLAGLAAAILAAGGEAERWGALMLASGLGIIALDAWANPMYFRQAKGVGTVAKLGLVVLMMAWEPGRLALFWFVLVFSVLLSHSPGRLRHRRVI